MNVKRQKIVQEKTPTPQSAVPPSDGTSTNASRGREGAATPAHPLQQFSDTWNTLVNLSNREWPTQVQTGYMAGELLAADSCLSAKPDWKEIQLHMPLTCKCSSTRPCTCEARSTLDILRFGLLYIRTIQQWIKNQPNRRCMVIAPLIQKQKDSVRAAVGIVLIG